MEKTCERKPKGTSWRRHVKESQKGHHGEDM
jgi:hypothetical protein